MKIGIITWFSGSNYGTNLQAIALQKYLRSIGHVVQIVNFEVYVTSAYKESFWEKVRRQPAKYMMKYAVWKYQDDIARRDCKLESIVHNQCHLTERVHSEADYVRECNQFDLLVCGSDQIWNPNWYHRAYYADYPDITTTKVSYAPSLGVNVIPENKAKEIKRGLQSFQAVSVREDMGRKLLEPLSPVEPKLVVDPTLLLDVSQWSELASQDCIENKPYVLSMFLTDRAEHWEAARTFAKRKGLKHVIVPYSGFSYMQPGRICANAGIEELLSLISHADYVLTDSFHISVFSIIFNRQFITFRRFKEDCYTSTNSRLENLLELSGLKDRMIAYKSSTVPNMSTIDYQVIRQNLDRYIDESKAYIDAAIRR